jgi:hypothetical protein
VEKVRGPRRRAARLTGGFVRSVGMLAAVLGMAACGSRGGRSLGQPSAPASDSAWLAAVGFPLRERGALLHLTAREISSMRLDSIAQLLETAPRVEVYLRGDGRKEYLLHRGSDWADRPDTDRGCPMDFYINGNQLQIRAADVVDLLPDRLFDPRNVTAVEIFRGADAPIGSETACGAVLFWVGRLRDSDDPPFTAILTGKIVRQPGNQPIAGVTVTAEPGGLTQVTNARGLFSFGAIPVAVYRLEADVPDWGKYRTEIGLRANSIGDVMIEVERR